MLGLGFEVRREGEGDVYICMYTYTAKQRCCTYTAKQRCWAAAAAAPRGGDDARDRQHHHHRVKSLKCNNHEHFALVTHSKLMPQTAQSSLSEARHQQILYAFINSVLLKRVTFKISSSNDPWRIVAHNNSLNPRNGP